MKNPPTLTKKEQECFNWIKDGGYLEDCSWNPQSTIDPNTTYAQRDKYGKWRDRYHHFPKRVVRSLMRKGLVVEAGKGFYQAKAVYEKEQKRKESDDYIPIMDTNTRTYRAQCPQGHFQVFRRGDKGWGKPILCHKCDKPYTWKEWTFLEGE